MNDMIWSGSYRDIRLTSWIYSLFALLLAVITVIMLLTAAANSAGRFVKDWRYITDAYIDAYAVSIGERAVVKQVVKANKPENLIKELDLISFGEGVHFSVHSQPDIGSVDTVEQGSTMDEARIGKRSLPYPPESVWCVYLDYTQKQDSVIFLGYHKDMYTAEWVAHIGEQAPFSTDFIKLLTNLECSFTSIGE
jgi:hypothetical protein